MGFKNLEETRPRTTSRTFGVQLGTCHRNTNANRAVEVGGHGESLLAGDVTDAETAGLAHREPELRLLRWPDKHVALHELVADNVHSLERRGRAHTNVAVGTERDHLRPLARNHALDRSALLTIIARVSVMPARTKTHRALASLLTRLSRCPEEH